MDDKLVVIKKFPSYIQAELAKQTLDDYGIKAFITGENAANVYSVPAIAETELQVLQSQAEKSLEILENQNQEK